MKLIKTLLYLAALVWANAALAVPIGGLGAPNSNAALTGATVIDFESVAQANYTSLPLSGVTINGAGGFDITSGLGGQYNSQGVNLQNGTQGAQSLTFLFSGTVSAFGFNFGASNEDWLLSAFDSSSNLIESYVLTQTWFSNAGEYFGIAASGIASATLTQLTHVNDAGADHILLDNLSFVSGASVPEPGMLSLLGMALCAAFVRRR